MLYSEDLRDAILLGKSYVGLVIMGVAERAPGRIHHLVYLDALVPRDGQSMLDILGPEGADRIRRVVAERGDGWRLPETPAGLHLLGFAALMLRRSVALMAHYA